MYSRVLAVAESHLGARQSSYTASGVSDCPPMDPSIAQLELGSPREFASPRPGIWSGYSAWLNTFNFDAFVTLATNDPSLAWRKSGSSADYVGLRVLREWDSRMHRKLVGRDWVNRVADRMWSFYFLEKPNSNPHWHALIQFCNAWPGLREKQQNKLRIHGRASPTPTGRREQSIFK
jgi:hypothetical protein